jgi:ubiquinone/menaquinone biosynthesis C-methylase UbiE
MKQPLMYADLAKYYDLVYRGKDYRKEAEGIIRLINKHKQSDGNDLLEVACGTGKHLQYLKAKFKCTGADINREMLKVARKRIPGVVFRQGNMINSRFGRKFDVITCLFSSIGYVKTYANLRKTIRNFARHLKKGGVVIIEPWFSKKQYRTGSVHLTAIYDNPEIKIARLSFARRKGDISIIDMHYLVAEKNKGVRHFTEQHQMGLFDVNKTLALMRKAGLKAEFIEPGPIGRGIYVGVKQ